MSQTVKFTGSPERFIVPTTGSYRITVDGAGGGASSLGTAGGGGAEVGGTFNLVAGEVVEIVVGGVGKEGSFGGGGGGASCVGLTDGSVLLIAGGGGGGGGYAGEGGPGLPMEVGGGVSGLTGAGGWNGTGGNGGGALGGGGGGGVDGSGGGAIFGAAGGKEVDLAGALGGAGSGGVGNGGFGGGAGGGYGGGGGGGYSGGGGGMFDQGGGGGGSIDNGSAQRSHMGSNAADGFVKFQLLCYLRGTHILTPSGEVPIERLSIGDDVITRFGVVRTLRWIGRQSYERQFPRCDPALMPVRIIAGALGDGKPRRDLYVTPGHSMLIGGKLILAKSLVNGVTVTQDWAPRRIDYFQLVFDQHDCVCAEGAWSETFADAAGMREQFHNIAKFDALYPNWASPAELSLCAPRPLSGPGLDAVLRPMAERIGRGLSVGPVEGYVDQCDDSGTITGWARDLKYPRLPVLIEAVAGDMVLGRALACDERGDLTEAGKGPCGFRIMAPIRLGPKARSLLRVRRASNHEELAMMPACRESLGHPGISPGHVPPGVGQSVRLRPAAVQPQPLRWLQPDCRFEPVVQHLGQRGHVDRPVASVG